jgi:hypothetical protein
MALTIDTDQKVDASVIAIHEWTGLRGQPLGLPCELLRKTVGQNFSQKIL